MDGEGLESDEEVEYFFTRDYVGQPTILNEQIDWEEAIAIADCGSGSSKGHWNPKEVVQKSNRHTSVGREVGSKS